MYPVSVWKSVQRLWIKHFFPVVGSQLWNSIIVHLSMLLQIQFFAVPFHCNYHDFGLFFPNFPAVIVFTGRIQGLDSCGELNQTTEIGNALTVNTF